MAKNIGVQTSSRTDKTKKHVLQNLPTISFWMLGMRHKLISLSDCN